MNPQSAVAQAAEDPDAENDIARNECLVQMAVGVVGRQQSQRIWVRGPKDKLSSIKYDPATNAPPSGSTLSILATTEETEGRPGTVECLVVGFVLAKDPSKYSDKATGVARDSARTKARQTQGILASTPDILRALIRSTEFVKTDGGTKFYIACHPLHGICETRLITMDAIFFFKEIWQHDVDESVGVKLRRTQLTTSCRFFAARDKKCPDRAQLKIKSPADKTASNDLEVTYSANAANVLLMQYSLYAMSPTTDAILALERTVVNLLPDLAKRPSNAGCLAFYDFSQALTLEDAELIINEIEATYPRICTLNPWLIVKIHAAILRTGLGNDIPYRSLSLFLRWAHDRVINDGTNDMQDECVRNIVRDIKISNDMHYMATEETSSDIKDGRHLEPLVASIKNALIEVAGYMSRQASALREQHGGVDSHHSIKDLMDKIGNCVDRTALKALEEQVFAIHAEQLATANSGAVVHIEKLVELVSKVIN